MLPHFKDVKFHRHDFNLMIKLHFIINICIKNKVISHSDVIIFLALSDNLFSCIIITSFLIYFTRAAELSQTQCPIVSLINCEWILEERKSEWLQFFNLQHEFCAPLENGDKFHGTPKEREIRRNKKRHFV